MSEETERMAAILAKGENATDIMEAVANGPVGATVPSVSGPIPTLLEWQDIHAEALGNVPALAGDLSALTSSFNALSLAIANSHAYAAPTISSGALTMDVSTAQMFGVSLNQNVTALTLSGATAGVTAIALVLMTQDTIGGHTVAFPASVQLPIDNSELVSLFPGDATLFQLVTVNGGTTWYAKKITVYRPGQTYTLPTVTGENSTFNDEATATTGWTQTNSTLTQSGSSLTHTKTAGAASSTSAKAVTLPTANRDFIIYGKARAKNEASNCAVIWLTDGTKELGLWFGSTDGGGTITAGAMSLTGYTASRQVASLGTGYDYQNVYCDFAISVDTTFGCATIYFRGADGLWNFKGRVLHTWFAVTEIKVQTPSASVAGAYLEFDFLTVASPNFIAIGDSICAGSTGFNPDMVTFPSLTAYASSWMRYANPAPTLRNNFIVNKGKGGQTDAQVGARFTTDVLNQNPQLIFLHASTNSEFNGVSFATKNSDLQTMISAANAKPAKLVLLSPMWGTAGGGDNVFPRLLRDYSKSWWYTQSSTLTGVDKFIDIMRPLLYPDGYQNPLLTVSDKLHPNEAGYALIGKHIAP